MANKANTQRLFWATTLFIIVAMSVLASVSTRLGARETITAVDLQDPAEAQKALQFDPFETDRVPQATEIGSADDLQIEVSPQQDGLATAVDTSASPIEAASSGELEGELSNQMAQSLGGSSSPVVSPKVATAGKAMAKGAPKALKVAKLTRLAKFGKVLGLSTKAQALGMVAGTGVAAGAGAAVAAVVSKPQSAATVVRSPSVPDP